MTRRCPNGETRLELCPVTVYWIHRYMERDPEKWNISVPGGKEINRDSVSSGERTRISLNRIIYYAVLRDFWNNCKDSIISWKTEPQRVTAPCAKSAACVVSIPSRAGHVKPGLNLGGPPSKAKYSLVTDSEPVPWGKGEKNPVEGSEIDPEIIHLQSVGELRLDCMPFA